MARSGFENIGWNKRIWHSSDGTSRVYDRHRGFAIHTSSEYPRRPRHEWFWTAPDEMKIAFLEKYARRCMMEWAHCDQLMIDAVSREFSSSPQDASCDSWRRWLWWRTCQVAKQIGVSITGARMAPLDDYEEGTWTQVTTFATSGDIYNGTIGSYTQQGTSGAGT